MVKKRDGKRVDTGRKKANGAPIYNWIKNDDKITDSSLMVNASSDFKQDDNITINDVVDYYSENVPDIEYDLEELTSSLNKNMILSKKDSEKLLKTIIDENIKNEDYHNSSLQSSLDEETRELINDSHDNLKEELYNYNLIYLTMSDYKIKNDKQLYDSISEKLSNNNIISINDKVENISIINNKYVITTDHNSIYLNSNNMKELLLDYELKEDSYHISSNNTGNTTFVQDNGVNRTITTSQGHSYVLPSRRGYQRSTSSHTSPEVVEEMKNYQVDNFKDYLEVFCQKESEYYGESFEYYLEDPYEEEKYYQAMNYYNDKIFNILDEELDNFDDIPSQRQWDKIKKKVNTISDPGF